MRRPYLVLLFLLFSSFWPSWPPQPHHKIFITILPSNQSQSTYFSPHKKTGHAMAHLLVDVVGINKTWQLPAFSFATSQHLPSTPAGPEFTCHMPVSISLVRGNPSVIRASNQPLLLNLPFSHPPIFFFFILYLHTYVINHRWSHLWYV